MAAAILFGLAGIVLPILPGLPIVVGAVLVWSAFEGGAAWFVAGVAVAVAVTGTVVKYLFPVRTIRDAGVPRSTVAAAAALGVLGFFVLPVIGGPIGFVFGTYLAERRRLGPGLAWPSTRTSLRALVLSVAIELAAGTLVAAAWLIGVVVI